jgi:hypothetical protein
MIEIKFNIKWFICVWFYSKNKCDLKFNSGVNQKFIVDQKGIGVWVCILLSRVN